MTEPVTIPATTAAPATRATDHRPADHRPADHRPADHRPADHRPADHRPAGQRTGWDTDPRLRQWQDERRRWGAALAVRVHATLVALSVAVVLVVWASIGLAGGGWHWWPVWPVAGTLLALATHALISTWVVRALASRPQPPEGLR